MFFITKLNSYLNRQNMLLGKNFRLLSHLVHLVVFIRHYIFTTNGGSKYFFENRQSMHGNLIDQHFTRYFIHKKKSHEISLLYINVIKICFDFLTFASQLWILVLSNDLSKDIGIFIFQNNHYKSPKVLAEWCWKSEVGLIGQTLREL